MLHGTFVNFMFDSSKRCFVEKCIKILSILYFFTMCRQGAPKAAETSSMPHPIWSILWPEDSDSEDEQEQEPPKPLPKCQSNSKAF